MFRVTASDVLGVTMPNDLTDIVDFIGSLKCEDDINISPALEVRMQALAEVFDRGRVRQPAELNIFTFHAQCDSDSAVIRKRDVERDNLAIDYRSLRRYLVWSARKHCRSSIRYLVSGRCEFDEALAGERWILLDLDRAELMFERVLAMCAYVHSAAFDKHTAFLDTDAFPNGPLARVFDLSFDVGLTFRTDPLVMPINEGVIFASATRKTAVRTFFRRYLGTYERLRADSRVERYYGDICAWRGGQLSLNVLALPADWPDANVGRLQPDLEVALLPCDPFNFSPSPDDPLLAGDMREGSKFIIHLKGQDKSAFARLSRGVPLDPSSAPCVKRSEMRG